MKFAIALTVGALFSALTAHAAPLACPDLTGSYSCPGDQGPSELVISQTPVNGEMIYSTTQDGDSTQTPVDEYTYTYNDTDNNVVSTSRSTCNANVFITTTSGQKKDGTTVTASWTITQSMSLTPKGDLQIQVQGQMTAQGQTQPEQDSSVCTREAAKPAAPARPPSAAPVKH